MCLYWETNTTRDWLDNLDVFRLCFFIDLLVLSGGSGKQKAPSGSVCSSARPGEDPFPLRGCSPGGHTAASEGGNCGFMRCAFGDVRAVSFPSVSSFWLAASIHHRGSGRIMLQGQVSQTDLQRYRIVEWFGLDGTLQIILELPDFSSVSWGFQSSWIGQSRWWTHLLICQILPWLF